MRQISAEVPAAVAAYHRLISEHVAGLSIEEQIRPRGERRRLETVAELVVAYLAYAQGEYAKNGAPTSEVADVRAACSYLTAEYADLPLAELGPLKLRAVRAAMIRRGLARSTINAYVHRLQAMACWAGEHELADPAWPRGLACVRALRQGRGGRETPQRQPVERAAVEAVLARATAPVAAMIELQWHAGLRPGEAVGLRRSALHRGGEVWFASVADHKSAHLGEGHVRIVPLGPAAQALLTPWIAAAEAAGRDWLFSPAVAVAELRERQRAGRIARGGGGNRKRRRPGRQRRVPAERYSVASYRRCIARACQAAGIPAWSPHRLRHSFATRVLEVCGSSELDALAAALGHRQVNTTLLYAHLLRSKGADLARRVG
ncbi:MAG TPA: tyrosine-type recombinase/integrase [Candidatus Omnitrophota bacterium]|nr:tyrosine-type recombinase/integrase [Candidatus Omnitrophota bacterium]